ncbi:ATP-binding protein [Actinomycetospora endophytica]|uniref:ATP-binding protein n=1 Tax=Actinomycetospora endophytica TaxID=2291215 RepID=A0ABS8P6X2_9PSEU|nr:ATP-binding protein [Actinomycetospora endophytica]MCD2193687.1 ATP-binding protein [Actinomycetospora endophytica]
MAAIAQNLRGLRHRLQQWVAAIGFDQETTGEIEAAVYEALTNVADHAYPEPGRPVRLAAATGGAVAEVQVSDHGRWHPPPADPGGRGRGLALMRALAGRVETATHPTGTTVTLSWALPHGDGAS